MTWIVIGAFACLYLGAFALVVMCPAPEETAKDMAFAYLIYSDDVTISPERREHAAQEYQKWMGEIQAKNRRERT